MYYHKSNSVVNAVQYFAGSDHPAIESAIVVGGYDNLAQFFFVKTVYGRVEICDTDWISTEEDGSVHVWIDEEFRREYNVY